MKRAFIRSRKVVSGTEASCPSCAMKATDVVVCTKYEDHNLFRALRAIWALRVIAVRNCSEQTPHKSLAFVKEPGADAESNSWTHARVSDLGKFGQILREWIRPNSRVVSESKLLFCVPAWHDPR